MSTYGSAKKVRAELKRIEALQRKWNALSMAERISIAKISPDLSLFFRPRIGLQFFDVAPRLAHAPHQRQPQHFVVTKVAGQIVRRHRRNPAEFDGTRN